MKFKSSYCSHQRANSPTVEDVLLSHDELNDHNKHLQSHKTRSKKISSSAKIPNPSQPQPESRAEERHLSRRWCYITSDDSAHHRVILEAPFVRMKEIHINPPRHPIKEDPKKLKLAETNREEGNRLYKEKNYSDALKYYSSAIDLCPQIASYYGNRSACYMMMEKYKLALEDAQKSVKLDPSFVKGYLREVRCFILFGDITAATRSLDTVIMLDSSIDCQKESKNLELLKKHAENCEKYTTRADYRSALFSIERSISIATECVRFKLAKAEYLVMLSRNQEAQAIVNDILRSDSLNVDAIYIRGLSLYYDDNIEKAFQHFQNVLRLCPDHSKAKDVYKKAKLLVVKKAEGNEAFKSNKLDDAYSIYTNALLIDPLNSLTNAKLYFNRALVNARLNKKNESVDDCTQAIKLDSTYVKAYLKRAKLYMSLEMFEYAIKDYEYIYKKEKSREHKQLLDSARLALKRSKKKDYYKILGISRNASDDEIKKAYRKHAMLHHPDRHSNSCESERKQNERKFKEIGEAYAVLSDSKKRSRYDNCLDSDANRSQGFTDTDPNNLFKTFWGNGNGFSGTSSKSPPFHFNFH